jgi:molecular chaperone DnaJ
MGIALTLKEIAEGVVKKVRIKRLKACPDCAGKGGTGMKPCSTCGGKGQVRRRMQSIFGEMVNVATCPDCLGTGESISNKCKACSGQKRVKAEETIEVKIPAGVASGNYLKLRGEGNASAYGGAAGSLIVHIEEKSDEFFMRDGQNLFCKVLVPVYRLALGGEQRVPTLYGEVKVKISAGLQPGTQLRVRGQGLPGYNSDYKGDLFV